MNKITNKEAKALQNQKKKIAPTRVTHGGGIAIEW